MTRSILPPRPLAMLPRLLLATAVLASPAFAADLECAVLNNRTVKGGFGGVFVTGMTPALLQDCVIAGNQANNDGGAIAVDDNATLTVSRCLIAGNELTAGCVGYCGPGTWSSHGSGICAFPAAKVFVESSAIVDNTGATTSPSEPPVGGLFGPMVVRDSIVRGNSGVQANLAALTHCDVEGGSPGVGNFDADPLFVHAAGGDYHVSSGSPCIDAGTPGLLDPDGSPLDVGAFPFASFYARRDVDAVDRTPGWSSVSAEFGGEHAWRVHLGAAAAGDLYVVLGSATGTAPATPLFGATLPLAFDGWFAATLAHPNAGPLIGTLGVLNAAGAADASLVVPPVAVVGPAKLWHAALVVDPAALGATATEVVELVLE